MAVITMLCPPPRGGTCAFPRAAGGAVAHAQVGPIYSGGRHERKGKMAEGADRRERSGPLNLRLHLVTAEVLIGEAFEPFAQFFAGGFLADGGGDFGTLEDRLLDEDG